MARLRDGRTRSDTISTTMRVTLRPDSMLDVPAGSNNGDDGENVERTANSSAWAIDAWSPRADEFAQEDEGIDWGNVVSRSVSVLSTAATVMLAISRF